MEQRKTAHKSTFPAVDARRSTIVRLSDDTHVGCTPRDEARHYLRVTPNFISAE